MRKSVIWWIRRDLRLSDNPALKVALEHGQAVLPVFVLDPLLWNSECVGQTRLAFMLGGLRALDAALRARGSRLIVRRGDPVSVLQSLQAEVAIEGIIAERDFSPYATKRDKLVRQALPLSLVDGLVVHSPGSVLKQDGGAYTVFTPFSRAWKRTGLPIEADLLEAPPNLLTPVNVSGDELPGEPVLSETVPFVPGEAEAYERLKAFTSGPKPPIYAYAENRNRPDLDGTSGLSPYLRFGMISARQVIVKVAQMIDTAPDQSAAESAEVFLTELIWREFYIHVLAHFPHVRKASFREDLRSLPWEDDRAAFEVWQAGKTGYPIVDAAMRQLLETGWMHNRARMIVASFLTKDLLIDWRWGEKHFMQHLVDGDPAANNGGWQWAAGTGTDAAPYFRIFNPVIQGEKFDPHGDYVRRWIPELAEVPSKYIHTPWRMTPAQQQTAYCMIGTDYPAPIVDHSLARARTLAAYARAKTPP